MYFIETKTYDPTFNLAIEEYLFNCAKKENDVFLFLWQNDKSVILGRNQNAFFECNYDFVKANNIKVIRRNTGGGAVYHDLGNLNYSFIISKDKYDRDFVMRLIQKTLSRFGIEANISGRNDLMVDNHKISGTAYFSNDSFVLQHGTLLCDVDLKTMDLALRNDKNKNYLRGIKSVRSRVVNLKDKNPCITIDKLKEEIKSVFCKEFGEERSFPLEQDVIANLQKKYSSKDWNLFEITEFDINKEYVFIWGSILVSLKKEEDRIVKVSIISDSLFSREISDFSNMCNNNIDNLISFLENFKCEKDSFENDLKESVLELANKSRR